MLLAIQTEPRVESTIESSVQCVQSNYIAGVLLHAVAASVEREANSDFHFLYSVGSKSLRLY